MNLKYRARKEQRKKNNRNREIIWFNPRIASKSTPTLVNIYLTSWISTFLNNVEYTRSLIEIMSTLVIHAQKICPLLFPLTKSNY